MECRILFRDKELQLFDWCKLDDSSADILDSGRSVAIDELKSVCSNGARVTIFLPQQTILLTTVMMPPKASKQQLNAISFAVEEKLANDIEDNFFATLPQQADNFVPVAVIDREIMDNCVQLMAKQHINASMILPQIYLCPWSDEDGLLASVCQWYDGYLVRFGNHAGLYCQSDILEPVLSLLGKQKNPDQTRLDIYAADNHFDTITQGLDIKLNSPVNLLSQRFDPHLCVNLKQKEYQSTHQWVELLKHWKWPVAAMILLALVFTAKDLFTLWENDQLYANLIRQQQLILKTHVPDLTPDDQPKKQLIQLLAKNQAGAGEAGFLDLLHEFSRLKTGFNTISTNKILYQQSSLVISLESKDLNSLESFRSQLEKSKFSAEIENVNINPDKTTGRLVMRAP